MILPKAKDRIVIRRPSFSWLQSQIKNQLNLGTTSSQALQMPKDCGGKWSSLQIHSPSVTVTGGNGPGQ